MPDDVSAKQHYVYCYIDHRNRVRYVGYGHGTDRPTSHLAGSHNAKLNEFLDGRQYRIEIAGPFDNEPTGRAVETALISALKPEYNINPGESRWRFRPLGVPLQYAERLVAPELLLSDFIAAQEDDPTPVLFVIVTSVNFSDEPEKRVGYNPADPPTDDQIRVRVDRWWQLRRYVGAWSARPQDSPGLLIGIFGSPGRQIVIASARIDQSGWPRAEVQPKGLLRVPLVEPVNLDVYALRGRRIAPDAGLRFGSFPSQFYILLSLDGVAVRGNPRK